MSKVSYGRWSILVVAAIASLFAILGALWGFNSTVSAADTAAGKAVFESNACSACHGVAGEGGLGPSLTTVAFAEKYANSDKLVSMIRQGGGSMPGFTQERISKEQMDNLLGYVKSLSQASAAKSSKAEADTSSQNADARYGGLTFAQLYGLVVVGLGAALLAALALILNGPLKRPATR